MKGRGGGGERKTVCYIEGGYLRPLAVLNMSSKSAGDFCTALT